MRSLWKGAISFGLVSVPVKLYAATERRGVNFNYLHEECKTPIKYKKWCPNCDREVPQEEIVRGYEYEKGRYVILLEEDFESIPLKTTRTVDIVEFVEPDEVDPVFYDKAYYLEPQEVARRPYAILRWALKETGKVGVAKVALRNKESLALVRVGEGDTLVMETLFYPDEVRSPKGLEIPGSESLDISEKEEQMAVLLVDAMSGPFEPEKYRDEYREALLELIRAKVSGQEVFEPKARPEDERVVDLLEALRRSIEAAEKEKEKAGAGAEK